MDNLCKLRLIIAISIQFYVEINQICKIEYLFKLY